METIPIIIFGFDYNEARTDVGAGTTLRCDHAVKVAKRVEECGNRFFFIVSPGRAPGVSQAEQPETMAQMMCHYLAERYGTQVHIEVGNPVWGTQAELDEATRLILSRQRDGHPLPSEVCLISNGDHLPRICLEANEITKRLGLRWVWMPEAAPWKLPSWTLMKRLEEFAKYLVVLFNLRSRRSNA